MTEIRSDLNLRLATLRDRVDRDVRIVSEYKPSEAAYQKAERNIQELRDVEATLATMQLADAQLEVAKAQRDVADQQRVANEAEAKQRSTAEESAFWARRFLTSITLANVGGLVAVLLFLSKPDSPLVPIASADWAVRLFMTGTFLGGAYPLAKITALWIWERKRTPLHAAVLADFVIPALATIALLVGTGVATNAVFEVYRERTASPAAPHQTQPSVASEGLEPKSSAS